MAIFTLIGYWADTHQRFATYVYAQGPIEAEEICLHRYRGVAICGVVRGRHKCLDTATHVNEWVEEETGLAIHD